MVVTIFVNRVYHQYAQGYNFPIWTTPKKFVLPSRAMGHFSGLTPVFGRFGPVSLHYNKYPYFWTVFTETWWDHPGHQKMTQNDNGPGPGWRYGETVVFTFIQKGVFGQKKAF